MESTRFDDLTKALATATSRRQALKAIVATIIGGLLGLDSTGTAFAKCHPEGHPCDENSTCCSKVCQNGVCVSSTTTTPAPTTTSTSTSTTTPAPTTPAPTTPAPTTPAPTTTSAPS